MELNEVVQVICINDTYDGYGRCILEDEVIFVKGLLENEMANVKILSKKKKVYFAKIMNLLETSQHRISSVCNVSNQCGGCSYIHIDYEYQLKKKQERVVSCLSQIAGLDVEVSEIMASLQIFNYRNKVQIPISDQPFKMGFYKPKTNDIVEFSECHVQSKLSNEIYHETRKWIKDLKLSKHIQHVIIKHAHFTNEVMIILVGKKSNIKGLDYFVERMTSKYPEILSIVLNLQTQNNKTILGDEEIIIYGQNSIQDKLGDYRFNISAKSFYQINSYQTLPMYEKVVELAGLSKEDVVVDLYCGTGTIGIFLAKHAKKVIGIDIVKEAIENARENALMNHIDNIEFISKDATIAIEEIIAQQQVDVIIVDPPRRGLSETGIKHIIQSVAKRVVYVSCDPATMARDVKLLSEKYHVETVIPVDMFPNTNHVECVVLMSRVEK